MASGGDTLPTRAAANMPLVARHGGATSSLFRAGLGLRELAAPVLAEKSDGRQGQQSRARSNEGGGNGPLEEDQPIAARHHQRLAQAELEGRRDDEAEHERGGVEVELAQE